ncbi:MAG: M48 family metallopeptidase [Beijerinckiaceae bacterium]|nr:M48 family metallopeptidase [Beijerinckiaceae bacterium]
MFQAYGLYTHIRKNEICSVLLLSGFVVLLHVLFFSFALLYEAAGAPRAAGVLIAAALNDVVRFWPLLMMGAAVWFAIAYVFNQAMIDLATGAQAVSREDAPALYNALENLCISRGLPMPSLRIIEDEALNAYASGLKPGSYSVTVTRGLLNALTPAELEAVLGHELTHIRNLDVRLLVISTIFVGFFGLVGELLMRNGNMLSFPSSRSSSRGNDKKGGAFIVVLLAIGLILLSWGASVLLKFAISRSREFLADAGAVELTKNPDAMISALRKIEMHAAMPSMPSQMSGFFIETPLATARMSGLFATHPSIDDRIGALIRFAGGRDPGPMPDLPVIDAPLSENAVGVPNVGSGTGEGHAAEASFLPAHLR